MSEEKSRPRPRSRITQTEPTAPIPESQPTIIESTLDKAKLKQLLAKMPELQMVPTTRYYGEEYYPKMTAIIAELKALAE